MDGSVRLFEKLLSVWWVIVLCASPALSASANSSDAKLPPECVGIWWPMSKEAPVCPTPLPEASGDTILTVTAKGFHIFEAARCDVLSVQTFEDSVLKAHFDCVGMGDLWNEETIMHVGDIGKQKVLVMATLGSSSHRDDAGNKIPDEPPGVGVWIKCEGVQ